MEELSRIQSRLESLEELDNLVGALRSMAGVRAGEARTALAGTRTYCAVVEEAIARVAPLARVREPGRAEGGAGALVVVTSENGFVGGFNTRLVENALAIRAPGERLLVVGRRGRITANEQGTEPEGDFAMASRATAVTPLARRLARTLEDAVTARLLFARTQGAGDFESVAQDILPPPGPKPEGEPAAAPPLIQIEPELLMARLASEYLFAKLADGLMESLASESLARLKTMDAASRKIEEKVARLQRDAHIAQQEKTTADLLDVIIGSEAARR